MSKAVKEAVQIAIQTNIPVLLKGDPGVGKTSFFESISGKLGWHLETVIVSIQEPSDFSGLPVIDNGSVRFYPPSWATAFDAELKGLLFFDEISTAPPSIQAGMLRVVQDRVVGGHRLPDNVAIVSAMNPADQANGFDLSAPMANRFCHIDWKSPSAKEWTEGMTAGWPEPQVSSLPDDWEQETEKALTIISSFLTANPTKLFNLPSNDTDAGGAWASPRSWDNASRLLGACLSIYGDFIGRSIPEPVNILIRGCIGDGIAIELLQYLKELDLPDPEMLLSQPDRLQLNHRSDRSFAILSSVALTAVRSNDRDKWHAAWFVLEEACKQEAIDVAASSAMKLVKHIPSGANIPEVALDRFVDLIDAVNG